MIKGTPLLADNVYGKRVLLAKNMTDALIQQLQQLKRQALHTHYLQLKHPLCAKVMEFHSPMPAQDLSG